MFFLILLHLQPHLLFPQHPSLHSYNHLAPHLQTTYKSFKHPISQNSNSASTVSFLPTTSQNLFSPISMPTSPPTSSPPHVLPNSMKSSPPSNHDMLYTLNLSPSTHVDSSSCLPGPKQPSHPLVIRSKNIILNPNNFT